MMQRFSPSGPLHIIVHFMPKYAMCDINSASARDKKYINKNISAYKFPHYLFVLHNLTSGTFWGYCHKERVHA